jgi:hypothetical protein
MYTNVVNRQILFTDKSFKHMISSFDWWKILKLKFDFYNRTS